MSHRWLLSLLCLSVLCLSLVQLTRASGALRVNEHLAKIVFEKGRAEVSLTVENSTGESLNATLKLKLLDPRNQVRAQTAQLQLLNNGKQTFNVTLPVSFSDLNETERHNLLLYRLQYELLAEGTQGNTLAEGILSLSEIDSDLFE